MSLAPPTRSPIAPIFEPLTDAHIGIAAPVVEDRVLDLACGTGAVARAAGVVSVVGADPDRARMQVARATTTPQLICVAARAEALPFRENAFSWVACQHGVMFFSDIGRALREIRRVLEPGGRTTLTAWSALARSAGFRVLNAALSREVGDAAERNAAIPFSMPDPDALIRPLQDAGFSDVVCHPIEIDVAYPSAREFALCFVRATSLAPVVARAGPNAAARVGDIVERELGGDPAGFHFVARAYCVSGIRLSG